MNETQNNKLSPQQQEAVDFVATQPDSLNVVSYAGTGKTTFIIASVCKMVEVSAQQMALCAFNKPIAKEMDGKLKKNGVDWKRAVAKTVHGFGWAAWNKVAPASCKDVQGNKLKNIMDVHIARKEKVMEDVDKIKRYKNIIIKLVDFGKQSAVGVESSIDDDNLWMDIIDHFGVDEMLPDAPPSTSNIYGTVRVNPSTKTEDAFDLEFVLKVTKWLYKTSLQMCHEVIDFSDMILAPLYFNTKFWQYDILYVDEAQDTNRLRRLLFKRMLKPGGKVVAVGDPHQAIYGFTGADSNSLQQIKDDWNSKELKLSVSFRCSQVAGRRAQKYVPDFEVAPGAPEGEARTVFISAKPAPGAKNQFYDEVFTKNDAILCRNTAPLVEIAYKLLRMKVPCRVEGKNIGDGLIAMCKKWSVKTTSALSNKLDDYLKTQTKKLLAAGAEEKVEQLADKVETIMVFISIVQGEGKTQISDVVALIDSMFGDTPEGQQPECTVLSTIHKAKGKEWERVYFLGFAKYMPSKYAKKPWQIEQEDNLFYVAYTRSKFSCIDVVVE